MKKPHGILFPYRIRIRLEGVVKLFPVSVSLLYSAPIAGTVCLLRHFVYGPVRSGADIRQLVYFLICLIATHFANGILQHDVLLEEVIYRNFVLCIVVHRALEEETQEALCTITALACCKV